MAPEFIQILDLLNGPQMWFMTLPRYVSMTILGLIVAVMLTLAGFALARMGYKPLWALLLLIPTISVIALWVVAYRAFPREKLPKNQ